MVGSFLRENCGESCRLHRGLLIIRASNCLETLCRESFVELGYGGRTWNARSNAWDSRLDVNVQYQEQYGDHDPVDLRCAQVRLHRCTSTACKSGVRCSLSTLQMLSARTKQKAPIPRCGQTRPEVERKSGLILYHQACKGTETSTMAFHRHCNL